MVKLFFLLEAGEEKSFDVLFIGTWGGRVAKNDRLLPDIVLRIVEAQ